MHLQALFQKILLGAHEKNWVQDRRMKRVHFGGTL